MEFQQARNTPGPCQPVAYAGYLPPTSSRGRDQLPILDDHARRGQFRHMFADGAAVRNHLRQAVHVEPGPRTRLQQRAAENGLLRLRL